MPFKYKLLNMFREFLVYHSHSLEFRAKLITLMVLSDDKISECEEEMIKKIAHKIYPKDYNRAEVLVETVHEYYEKIKTQNNLDYESLITEIIKDLKQKPRFVQKIDTNLLREFEKCQTNEEERIFQERIIEFLEYLKKEYSQKGLNEKLQIFNKR
ncbi:MAG: hypothetical protein GXO02_05065 [Epsilonproteobacteria bacterium]|nr:hypothetical protein [Campylobacterota bacterium]